MDNLEAKFSTIDALNGRLAAWDDRLSQIEMRLSQFGGIKSTVDQLSHMVNDLALKQKSLHDKCASVERRCTLLEKSAISNVPSQQPNHGIGNMSARLEKYKREQRDQELIIFGLPNVHQENRANTLSLVPTYLGTLISPSEIIDSDRIDGRDPSSCPLTTKVTTVSKRNEIIALACRRRGFTAVDINPSWPASSIVIHERSSAFERRTFGEANGLAGSFNIKYVWMRRGITYFRRADGLPSYRYLTSESFRQQEAVHTPATTLSTLASYSSAVSQHAASSQRLSD